MPADPQPPALPLVAYEVCEAVSAAADPEAFHRVATCRTAAAADYLVRVLESLRASGLLFGPDHDGLATFARPVERTESVGASASAAIGAGYVVRAVVGDEALEVPGALPPVAQGARLGAAPLAPAGPSSGRPPGARGLV